MKKSLKEINAIIDDAFAGIVGQTEVKNQLRDSLTASILGDGFFPNIIFIAPPGLGKTMVLKALYDLFKTLLGRKRIYFQDGSEMSNKETFFHQILVEHMNDEGAMLICDEFHSTNSGVFDLIRAAINPTADRAPQEVVYMGESMMFDPCKSAMVFATNEFDKIPQTIKGRTLIIELQSYTDEEMAQIIFQGLAGEIKIEESGLLLLSGCARGTARSIQHQLNSIKEYSLLNGKKSLAKTDCAEILRKTGVYPLGISKNELKVLTILERGEQQLKELAAKLQTSSSQQTENEKYLIQRNLITISGKRFLTPDGRKYMKSLRNEGYLQGAPVTMTAIIS